MFNNFPYCFFTGYWEIRRDGLFVKEQVFPSAIIATRSITPKFHHLKVVEIDGQITSLSITPDLQIKLPQLFSFFELKHVTIIDEHCILYVIK